MGVPDDPGVQDVHVDEVQLPEHQLGLVPVTVLEEPAVMAVAAMAPEVAAAVVGPDFYLGLARSVAPRRSKSTASSDMPLHRPLWTSGVEADTLRSDSSVEVADGRAKNYHLYYQPVTVAWRD